MAEFDGVVDQIVHYLLNLSQIGVDHLNIVGEGQIKIDVFLLARSLEGSRRVLNHPVDIKIRAV